MAAYLNVVCSFIYPGRDVAGLTHREAWTLVNRVLGSRDAPSTLAHIPELVSRVLHHIHIKHRERVRQVCHIWNKVASDLRTAKEICSLTSRGTYRVPIQENTIHLGLIAERCEYIQWARTREEFSTLWKTTRHLRYIRYFPCPRFVTQNEYPQVYKLMRESVIQRVADITEFYIWVIRLPYELFVQTSLDLEHMSYMYIPHKLHSAIAGSLVQDSRAGTLDPRKIFHLHNQDLLWAISGALRVNSGLGLEYSPLIRIASQCPEIALYNWLHKNYSPNPTDFTHPRLGALMVRLTSFEPTTDDDPETFRARCLVVLGKK